MWHVLLDSTLHDLAATHLSAAVLSAPGDGGVAVPNPPPAVPPGKISELVMTLLGWGKWFVLVSGMAAMLICAGMVILGRRNRNQLAFEGMIGIVWVLGGLGIAATAAGLVGVFATLSS